MTPRRLLAALVYLARMRASERRFRRHQRARDRHDERALRHARAMAAELQHRVDLCARYEAGRGASAPRSRSGVPMLAQETDRAR